MAGWLVEKLRSDLFQIVDGTDRSKPPTVEASVTSPRYDTFTRILQGQFYDTEEVRIERPSNYDGGCEYVGVAPNGSSTTLPVWDCVRCVWVNKQKTRIQYKQGIAWEQRAIGW